MLRISEIPEAERSALRTMADAYWHEIMPRIVQDPARLAQYFETRFAAGTGRNQQWRAKLDQIVVGFANAELLMDDMGDTYGYLKDFYILPEWRRQGHGAAFARLVFQWIKEHGARRVSLHTRLDSPAATAFWQHLGCEPRLYIMRKPLD